MVSVIISPMAAGPNENWFTCADMFESSNASVGQLRHGVLPATRLPGCAGSAQNAKTASRSTEIRRACQCEQLMDGVECQMRTMHEVLPLDAFWCWRRFVRRRAATRDVAVGVIISWRRCMLVKAIAAWRTGIQHKLQLELHALLVSRNRHEVVTQAWAKASLACAWSRQSCLAAALSCWSRSVCQTRMSFRRCSAMEFEWISDFLRSILEHWQAIAIADQDARSHSDRCRKEHLRRMTARCGRLADFCTRQATRSYSTVILSQIWFAWRATSTMAKKARVAALQQGLSRARMLARSSSLVQRYQGESSLECELLSHCFARWQQCWRTVKEDFFWRAPVSEKSPQTGMFSHWWSHCACRVQARTARAFVARTWAGCCCPYATWEKEDCAGVCLMFIAFDSWVQAWQSSKRSHACCTTRATCQQPECMRSIIAGWWHACKATAACRQKELTRQREVENRALLDACAKLQAKHHRAMLVLLIFSSWRQVPPESRHRHAWASTCHRAHVRESLSCVILQWRRACEAATAHRREDRLERQHCQCRTAAEFNDLAMGQRYASALLTTAWFTWQSEFVAWKHFQDTLAICEDLSGKLCHRGMRLVDWARGRSLRVLLVCMLNLWRQHACATCSRQHMSEVALQSHSQLVLCSSFFRWSANCKEVKADRQALAHFARSEAAQRAVRKQSSTLASSCTLLLDRTLVKIALYDAFRTWNWVCAACKASQQVEAQYGCLLQRFHAQRRSMQVAFLANIVRKECAALVVIAWQQFLQTFTSVWKRHGDWCRMCEALTHRKVRRARVGNMGLISCHAAAIGSRCCWALCRWSWSEWRLICALRRFEVCLIVSRLFAAWMQGCSLCQQARQFMLERGSLLQAASLQRRAWWSMIRYRNWRRVKQVAAKLSARSQGARGMALLRLSMSTWHNAALWRRRERAAHTQLRLHLQSRAVEQWHNTALTARYAKQLACGRKSHHLLALISTTLRAWCEMARALGQNHQEKELLASAWRRSWVAAQKTAAISFWWQCCARRDARTLAVLDAASRKHMVVRQRGLKTWNHWVQCRRPCRSLCVQAREIARCRLLLVSWVAWAQFSEQWRGLERKGAHLHAISLQPLQIMVFRTWHFHTSEIKVANWLSEAKPALLSLVWTAWMKWHDCHQHAAHDVQACLSKRAQSRGMQRWHMWWRAKRHRRFLGAAAAARTRLLCLRKAVAAWLQHLEAGCSRQRAWYDIAFKVGKKHLEQELVVSNWRCCRVALQKTAVIGFWWRCCARRASRRLALLDAAATRRGRLWLRGLDAWRRWAQGCRQKRSQCLKASQRATLKRLIIAWYAWTEHLARRHDLRCRCSRSHARSLQPVQIMALHAWHFHAAEVKVNRWLSEAIPGLLSVVWTAWVEEHASQQQQVLLDARACLSKVSWSSGIRRWHKWWRARAQRRFLGTAAAARVIRSCLEVALAAWLRCHSAACNERRFLATRAAWRQWCHWRTLQRAQRHALEEWFVRAAAHDVLRTCREAFRWWCWHNAWTSANLEAAARQLWERRHARLRLEVSRRRAVGFNSEERAFIETMFGIWRVHHVAQMRRVEKSMREYRRHARALLLASLDHWVAAALPPQRAENLCRRRRVRFSLHSKESKAQNGTAMRKFATRGKGAQRAPAPKSQAFTSTESAVRRQAVAKVASPLKSQAHMHAVELSEVLAATATEKPRVQVVVPAPTPLPPTAPPWHGHASRLTLADLEPAAAVTAPPPRRASGDPGILRFFKRREGS